MRPGTYDDVFCPGAFESNFVRQAAAFGQHEEVERVAEMLVIHDRVGRRVRALEPHLPARLSPKQRRHHRKGLLVVPGLLAVRFRAVALRVPHLDVGLPGSETHWVAPFFVAGGFLPEFRVGELLV